MESVGRFSANSHDILRAPEITLSDECLGDDPRDVDVVYAAVDAYDCRGLSLRRSR